MTALVAVPKPAPSDRPSKHGRGAAESGGKQCGGQCGCFLHRVAGGAESLELHGPAGANSMSRKELICPSALHKPLGFLIGLPEHCRTFWRQRPRGAGGSVCGASHALDDGLCAPPQVHK